ncbi:hypothetical protein HGRIS_010115 [Hohenbuehelia grisea]|uniref:Uncharacterized protein n=1 Tax=Hohenbuehelia grisea TaxID=104357 RepID=A0ABR3J3B8_9AGAR
MDIEVKVHFSRQEDTRESAWATRRPIAFTDSVGMARAHSYFAHPNLGRIYAFDLNCASQVLSNGGSGSGGTCGHAELQASLSSSRTIGGISGPRLNSPSITLPQLWR